MYDYNANPMVQGPQMQNGTQAQFLPMQPVPQPTYQAPTTTGIGFTQTPNPFVAQSTPPWMQGWFGAPWWGMSATGQPLTQQDLQAQAQAPAAAPGQATPGASDQAEEEDYADYLKWRQDQLGRGPVNTKSYTPGSNGGFGGISRGTRDRPVDYGTYLMQKEMGQKLQGLKGSESQKQGILDFLSDPHTGGKTSGLGGILGLFGGQ